MSPDETEQIEVIKSQFLDSIKRVLEKFYSDCQSIDDIQENLNGCSFGQHSFVIHLIKDWTKAQHYPVLTRDEVFVSGDKRYSKANVFAGLKGAIKDSGIKISATDLLDFFEHGLRKNCNKIDL